MPNLPKLALAFLATCLILFCIAFALPREDVSEGMQAQTLNAPQYKLEDYQPWLVGDSTMVCNPKGCADVPEGSILLTPIPRDSIEIIPPAFY